MRWMDGVLLFPIHSRGGARPGGLSPEFRCAHIQHGGGISPFPPGAFTANAAVGEAPSPRPCPHLTWWLWGQADSATLALPTGRGAAASRDVTGAWSRCFCIAAGGSGKRIRIAFLCSVEESALWS